MHSEQDSTPMRDHDESNSFSFLISAHFIVNSVHCDFTSLRKTPEMNEELLSLSRSVLDTSDGVSVS